MGDATTPLTAAEARHLLRRSGLGFLSKDLKRIIGRPRGQAVDDLLNFYPDNFQPAGTTVSEVHDAWLRYMVPQKKLPKRAGFNTIAKLARSRHALQEKLVLFWHDHFATAASKVLPKCLLLGGDPALYMAMQNALLRQHCVGDFKALVKAINKDLAMIRFLDTDRNFRLQPNENYARELMELFTLGVYDSSGNANYTQADIVQIARAFSGWQVDSIANTAIFVGGTGASCNTSGFHDYTVCYPSRGPKVIFQTSGGFGAGGRDFSANGEGAQEIDTVIDILFDHLDSSGHSTVARHIAGKLFAYFASPAVDLAAVDAMIAASSFDTQWDVRELLRAMFVDDSFYTTLVAPGASAPKSVKWPADYVVGTLRQLRVQLADPNQYVAGTGNTRILQHLTRMGQKLLDPPSVFGWDWEQAWLSTSTMLGRFSFANAVISARGSGRTGFMPQKLVRKTLSDPAAIVAAVTAVLGVDDQLNASETQYLIDYLGPGPIDLRDTHVRNTKLNGLFALVLESPAYQLH